VPKGWPPLTWQEIVACLEALGFVYDRTESSHRVYVHLTRRRTVPVSTNWSPCSGPMIKHLVVTQAGLTREAFYRATKATARKI
jgi:predicted RNA binding protein YcfA (HicA-like mRNA interferase family)